MEAVEYVGFLTSPEAKTKGVEFRARTQPPLADLLMASGDTEMPPRDLESLPFGCQSEHLPPKHTSLPFPLPALVFPSGAPRPKGVP